MKREIFKNLTLVSQLGIIMVVTIGGCLYIGKYLDGFMGTRYIFMLIFIILGVISAFLNIYKLIMKNFDEKK
ncbi:MAG: AtpZ/AtpI family protein [Anaeromicrobium sp.]|uniref:AtpZ/AtpI family protein n=1 Tax=Anaeromicrobium sp. TaxID=1929132 RepID=UPI0026000282|nr:AtpZ/AtpI family protein [Anaeromicrobium sp.]MCT4592766.1 AtpZ/AtpI family protein [Anaeromicrobium sp.]